MKAYLAIIADSFREAFASRVLWVVLIGCTLLLVATLPGTVEEHIGAQVARDDLVKPAELLAELKAAGKSPENTAGKRIWERLDGDFKRTWARKLDDETAMRMPNALVDALNDVIDQPDLYDPDAWPHLAATSEVSTLIVKRDLGSLTTDQARRMNRLLIESAYPEHVLSSSPTEINLFLLGNEVRSGVLVPKNVFLAEILAFVLDFFIGTFGVFVAVLVTSSIVPQTFEPGAVDLLLSKPVSRWLVFLTRFAGGCAFIIITGGYLVVGLWLILGLWHGWWCHAMLWTLPVFVLLFAIYFSVSALTGLFWRNAIVSVAVTVLFWGLCWSLGVAHTGVQNFMLNPTRLVRVLGAGDDVITVNEQSEFYRWNSATSTWDEIFHPLEPEMDLPIAIPTQPVVGPIYDPAHKRMLAIVHPLPFPPRTLKLSSGQAADKWIRHDDTLAPERTHAMFLEHNGDLLAVSQRGIFRSTGDAAAKNETGELFGFQVPLPNRQGQFAMVSRDLRLSRQFAAGYDPDSRQIVVFDTPHLIRLARDDDGRYAEVQRVNTGRIEPGLLGHAGKHWVVAHFDGGIELRDDKLDVVKTFRPAGSAIPRQVSSSMDQRLIAVVYHSGRCWLYDMQADEDLSGRLRENSEVGAVSFTDQSILVADRYTRVTRYAREGLAIEQTLQPALGFGEKAYRYLLNPLFRLLPKPGRLGNAINELVTERNTMTAVSNQRIESPYPLLDVWGPVRDGLIFTALMLVLSCWYVSRRDF